MLTTNGIRTVIKKPNRFHAPGRRRDRNRSRPDDASFCGSGMVVEDVGLFTMTI